MVDIKFDKILGLLRERDTISGSVSLNDLSDVTITSPQIDNILIYNGSGWVNSINKSINFSYETVVTTVELPLYQQMLLFNQIEIAAGGELTVAGTLWFIE